MRLETIYLHPPKGTGFSRLTVEVPETAEEMRIGLSGRWSLYRDQGMLFRFHGIDPVIWMKNTHIPLDISFADENGRILAIVPGVPESLARIRGPGGSRYVLETNAGVLRSLGISVGSHIRV